MALATPTAASLVDLLGPHPATLLALDLDGTGDADLGAWLVATVLLGGRGAEELALRAFERLRGAGLVSPAAICNAGAGAVQLQLEAAGVAKCEVVTAVIARVCRRLERDHGGSIDALAADADGLEDLAGRLARLGAGFGRSAVLRFLTPLRERWTAANDLPASAPVCSAARDLRWIPETQDEEGAPASLARWLRNEAEPSGVPASGSAGSSPALRDVEAALDRLGRLSCLRGRSLRCPLEDRCPRNAENTRNER